MDTVSRKKNAVQRKVLALIAGICFTILIVVRWVEVKELLIFACHSSIGEQACANETLHDLASGFLWGLVLLPTTFGIEYSFPADKRQPLLSTGFKQDSVYFVWSLIFRVFFLGIFSAALYSFGNNYLSFIRIDFLVNLPAPTQIIIVILCSDFMGWFTHWLRHKIRPLWFFHAVHHSQRELNYFAGSRFHPIDSITARLIRFIPFFALQFDLAVPVYVAWNIFHGWQSRLYHSNIKASLGVVSYILVTPQYHRIHHSILPEHQDRNFGVAFSFWDHLFGTAYHEQDQYPDTGITDPMFPSENGADDRNRVITFLAQLLYPFRKLWVAILKRIQTRS